MATKGCTFSRAIRTTTAPIDARSSSPSVLAFMVQQSPLNTHPPRCHRSCSDGPGARRSYCLFFGCFGAQSSGSWLSRSVSGLFLNQSGSHDFDFSSFSRGSTLTCFDRFWGEGCPCHDCPDVMSLNIRLRLDGSTNPNFHAAAGTTIMAIRRHPQKPGSIRLNLHIRLAFLSRLRLAKFYTRISTEQLY